MADDFTRSIEDNYPEYVLETFGYQYDALEVIDREALTRHDNLRHASREELERAMGDGEGVERDALDANAPDGKKTWADIATRIAANPERAFCLGPMLDRSNQKAALYCTRQVHQRSSSDDFHRK